MTHGKATTRLIERLRSLGIVKRGRVVEEVFRATPTQIIEDALASCAAEVREAGLPTRVEEFSHFPSLSLGGGAGECSSVDCRVRRVREVSNFAVLVSDAVYYNDFLAPYVHDASHGGVDASARRTRMRDDIEVVLYAYPMIKSGLLRPFLTTEFSCAHCLVEAQLGDRVAEKLRKSFEKLARKYDRYTNVKLRYSNGRFLLDHDGPETLFEHPLIISRKTVHEALSKEYELVGRAVLGEEIELSREHVRSMMTGQWFAGNIARNVAFELHLNAALHTSYVSHRKLHVDFLREVSGSARFEPLNRLCGEQLSVAMPFIHGAPLDALARLRDTEGDSFLVYRNALKEAVAAVRGNRKSLDAAMAREIHQGVIAPNLARLNQSLRSARLSFERKASPVAYAGGALLTFGVFLGLPPDMLVAATAALGGSIAARELLNRGIDRLVDRDGGIREDPFYFLWRVREAAETPVALQKGTARSRTRTRRNSAATNAKPRRRTP